MLRATHPSPALSQCPRYCRQELGAAEQARIMQADSRLRRMLQVSGWWGAGGKIVWGICDDPFPSQPPLTYIFPRHASGASVRCGWWAVGVLVLTPALPSPHRRPS